MSTPPDPQALPPLGAGRAPALAAVSGWLRDPISPQLCFVTGSPGSGKSTLLTYLAVADARTDRVANGMLSARGMTIDAVAWAIAEELALPAETPSELIAGVAADTRKTTLIIGEIDESGVHCDGAAAGQIIGELLNPLLTAPHVRVIVEGRAEIASAFHAPAHVVQLDDPALTDSAEFDDWLHQQAAGQGMTDLAVIEAAASAFPNPALAVAALRTGPGPGAFERWPLLLPEQAWPAIEALMSAYEPLDDEAWLILTRALTSGDAQQAHASMEAARPFTGRIGDRVRPVCRPLREAVRRARPIEVRAQMDSALDQALYLAQPLAQPSARHVAQAAQQGALDWPRMSPYARRHLLRHAARSGVIDWLLQDAGCLAYAEPSAVTAAFTVAVQPENVPGPVWRSAGRAVSVSGDPADRAVALRLSALRHQDHGLADRLIPYAAPAAWAPRWSLARPVETASGHWPGPVTALVVGSGRHEGELIAAGEDGLIYRLARQDGSPVGRIPSRDTTQAAGALVSFADGALIALGAHGSLRLVKGEAPQSQAARISSLLNDEPGDEADAGTQADATTAFSWLDAYEAAPRTALGTDPEVSQLAVGDASGVVHTWDLTTGEPSPVSMPLHKGPVTAVACLRGEGGGRLVISGGADGKVRLWGPGTEPMPEPGADRDQQVIALATGILRSRPVAAIGWRNGEVVLWDLTAGAKGMVRLGFMPTALAFAPDGTLFVGDPHGVTALVLAPDRLFVPARPDPAGRAEQGDRAAQTEPGT